MSCGISSPYLNRASFEIRETFFGSLTTLATYGHLPQIERAIFHSDGRPHKHDKWENCIIVSGSGIILQDWTTYNANAHPDNWHKSRVFPNSIVSIPPNTLHYMRPDKEGLDIILTYTDEKLPIGDFLTTPNAKKDR